MKSLGPTSLKWSLALGGLASLLLLAYLVRDRLQFSLPETANDQERSRRGVPGVVQLDAERVREQGIEAEPAQATAWYPRLTVYGRVVPNPQATVEVRAPFAGTLRVDPQFPWPIPGRLVQAGQLLGRVLVRVNPQERLDFKVKLGEARLRQRGAEEVVKVHQGRLQRLKSPGTVEVVSRRELDEATVALAEARTQLATAQAAVELWEKALRTIEEEGERPHSTWSEPLRTPLTGVVTEVAAQPGTSVDANSLVARIVDFSRILLRLDFPAEALAGSPPSTIEVIGAEQSLPATLVGPAPLVDAASQLAGCWYEVRVRPGESGRPWRPGLFVKASLRCGTGQARAAMSLPRSALLYHQGRTLVYVRLTLEKYERRQVQVLGQEGDRWVVTGSLTPGEAVVSRQAQVLLSAEFLGDGDID